MKETIQVSDFWNSAVGVESMNEELTDTDEAKAWMICTYFCSYEAEDCWSDCEDFPYKFIKRYTEKLDYGVERYYGIYERKSDGKLFKIWVDDYEEVCDELVEVIRKTVTKEVFE